MSINFEKKTMNDVVTHLIPKTTKFVEDNYFELSSAGKYQVAILTAVCFIKMLEDLSNSIDCMKVIEDKIFEEEFLNVFDFYKKQYLQSNKHIPKYNLNSIDAYNKFGNESMLKMNQTRLKVDIFKLLFHENYSQLKRFQEAVVKFNKAEGLYPQSEMQFINIFYCPFFILPPHNLDKKEQHLEMMSEARLSSLSTRKTDSGGFLSDFTQFTTQAIINILS